MFAAGAFGDGDGFAPGAAVVGAAARDDVDVLREVSLVILAAVAGDEERAVGEAADGWDAPVGAAVVARPEEALLVVLDGLGWRKGVGRVGYVDGGLLATECQQDKGDDEGCLHEVSMGLKGSKAQNIMCFTQRAKGIFIVSWPIFSGLKPVPCEAPRSNLSLRR